MLRVGPGVSVPDAVLVAPGGHSGIEGPDAVHDAAARRLRSLRRTAAPCRPHLSARPRRDARIRGDYLTDLCPILEPTVRVLCACASPQGALRAKSGAPISASCAVFVLVWWGSAWFDSPPFARDAGNRWPPRVATQGLGDLPNRQHREAGGLPEEGLRLLTARVGTRGSADRANCHSSSETRSSTRTCCSGGSPHGRGRSVS